MCVLRLFLSFLFFSLHLFLFVKNLKFKKKTKKKQGRSEHASMLDISTFFWQSFTGKRFRFNKHYFNKFQHRLEPVCNSNTMHASPSKKEVH